MVLTTRDLPAFVIESDRRGGPGSPACEQYWLGMEYRPDTVVDQSLDPFSDAYVGQQLALYQEMSGRRFDQTVNEHTTIDIETHAAAVNPYDHGSPGGLALHIERLSRAFRLGGPRRGGKLLDMGCGWGLSSEVAAYCGLNVTAVDVNADFVDLVNRRAARLNIAMSAQVGTFDDFDSSDRFDCILFYECFHHALRPWTVLERMARLLDVGGKVVLAGEPINTYWWKNWGLRLDPLSVYCIHKFGWLESGWSPEFLEQAFGRAGLSFQIVNHPEGEVGYIVLGGRTELGTVIASEIYAQWRNSGWSPGGGVLTSHGRASVDLQFPADTRSARLTLKNFRGRPMPYSYAVDGAAATPAVIDGPIGYLEIERGRTDRVSLEIVSETWCPDEELGNGDRRSIGLHLQEVVFL